MRDPLLILDPLRKKENDHKMIQAQTKNPFPPEKSLKKVKKKIFIKVIGPQKIYKKSKKKRMMKVMNIILCLIIDSKKIIMKMIKIQIK